MTLLRPFAMQPAGGDSNINISAQEFRQLVAAIFRGSGVMGGSSLKITQRGAGANWSFDVAEGNAIIPGTDTTAQESYVCTNTADAYNVTQFASGSVPYTFSAIGAPGSGSRTHRVVAQVKDYRNLAGWAAGTYGWDVLCLQDTGGGTPAVPASAIGLARITITSASGSITDAMITDDRKLLPTLGYGDPWHNLTLQHGWSNRGASYVRAQYKQQYLGGGLAVTHVCGEITGGTASDGTVIATLPAGWTPAVSQHIWCAVNGRNANNDPPSIYVTSGGDLMLYNCGGANTIFFSGTIYQDATAG